MRSPLSRIILGVVFVAGAAALWVIPSFAQVPGTQPMPGMNVARVWINNQKPEDAIPVTMVSGDPRMPMPVAVVGTATVSVSGLTPVVASRQNWEYRSVAVGSGQDVAGSLAGLGNDGWEAVGLTTQINGNVTVLLKRPR